METAIYTSQEVSLECLSSGSDPRCIMRWCCALTFFLNLVPGSKLMSCHKIYLSPVIDSPGRRCLTDDYLTVHSWRVDLTGHVRGQPLVAGEVS